MSTEVTDTGNISVVIPAYNAAGFLPATLQSVSNQLARPGEVIVVDDGSTDNTPDIARSFGATVLTVANGGPSAARNAGTRAARGTFIAYLDADDVWVPEKLSTQLAALQSLGRPAFSFTDYRMFDETGVFARPSELQAHWAFRKVARKISGGQDVVVAAGGNKPVLYDSYIPPSTVLARRADVLEVGGFDETLFVTEDYEFFLRLFRIVPAVVVMKPLVLYRRHAGQATSKATRMESGFFDVAQRVAASPERYPPGDARYILETEYLRHFRLGMQQSRLGQFDDAIHSFGQSLAARRTVRARLALVGSEICRSAPGRFAFSCARTLWKRRPGKR